MIIKMIGRNILLVSLVLILQVLILVLSAKAISCSIVQLSAGPDLILLSILISIATVIYYARSKSNDMRLMVITAVFYFVLIISFSILKNGFYGNEAYYIKVMICIICGEMIGTFLGSKRFNKLRKSTKKRLQNTK